MTVPPEVHSGCQEIRGGDLSQIAQLEVLTDTGYGIGARDKMPPGVHRAWDQPGEAPGEGLLRPLPAAHEQLCSLYFVLA